MIGHHDCCCHELPPVIVEFHRAIDDPCFPALSEVKVDLADSRIDYVCDACGRRWSEYWSTVGFADRFEIIRALEPRDGGRFRTRMRAWVDRRLEDRRRIDDRRRSGRWGGRRSSDRQGAGVEDADTTHSRST